VQKDATPFILPFPWETFLLLTCSLERYY
jgi:hypothetical protein